MTESKLFLRVCVDEVIKSILEEIRSSHYCDFIVDGIPDVSHSEEFVFIVRQLCVKIESEKLMKNFWNWLTFKKTLGEGIADEVKSISIDLSVGYKSV